MTDDTGRDEGEEAIPHEILATRSEDPEAALSAADETLLSEVLDGDQRALARVLTKIENRADGARDLLAALHDHTGTTPVLGVTGSPGAGKSTLVDELTDHYREQGERLGILAVDPSSPYTGGSVLGDRIRMGSTAGDEGVFIRSMSARGRLGGLSMATSDAVTALDAFGMDRIIIETVGAGQNEVDIVETADTVVVVVQPGSGDDVQLLKAGILEIGDIFVVNKADMDGAAQTAADLEAMVHGQQPTGGVAGHHTPDASNPSTETDGDAGRDRASERQGDAGTTDGASEGDDAEWTPPVVETVATTGDGIDEFTAAIADHDRYLDRSGDGEARQQQRAAATLQRLLQQDLGAISEQLLAANGGLDALAAAVADRQTDPYTLVQRLTDPVASAIEQIDGHE
ncbi:MAG: LAO/AO transport system ATPase [uncultured archaeon A07HN63]|nr:MAG: LAO/AO transport system ATPase [uncultured archaeon A07HN63]